MKKNLKYIIASLFCVMLFAACDDFLDTDNLTMKDTSNFPVNETDAYQMVNGIYSVKYKVEEFTGLEIEKINIYVEGVRVID